jgi:two-component system OmpR family sensor kinase
LLSAGLTLLILLAFALVVGEMTVDRLRSNFDNDVRSAAESLRTGLTTAPGSQGLLVPAQILRPAAAGHAVIRITNASASVEFPANGPDLPPPGPGLRTHDGYRVATERLVAGPGEVGYLQYGRATDGLEATIARLRLFLALGVLAGAGLALVAGVALGRRAMAPIADLTAAAKAIAKTRNPDYELPRTDVNDEVGELGTTFHDMLASLSDARTQTERMLALQKTFVADASHELRTPLTSILSNLDLLEHALDGEEREMAGSALRSARRMRELVSDLLILARSDAQEARAREPVDLTVLVRAALAEAAPVAIEHEFTLSVPEDLVLLGSPHDLHRLTLNLVENAAIHTPPGTHISIVATETDGSVVLSVEDNGPGIPEEIRERVFDRFVSGGKSETGGGTGLGLALVKAVAESHGGSVSYEPVDGGGSRFLVSLPARRQHDVSTEKTSA